VRLSPLIIDRAAHIQCGIASICTPLLPQAAPPLLMFRSLKKTSGIFSPFISEGKWNLILLKSPPEQMLPSVTCNDSQLPSLPHKPVLDCWTHLRLSAMPPHGNFRLQHNGGCKRAIILFPRSYSNKESELLIRFFTVILSSVSTSRTTSVHWSEGLAGPFSGFFSFL